MNIGEILKKVAEGQTLTDAEKKMVAEFDVQKATDDAAAAARRKAEDRQKDAEKERDDLKKTIADLQAKVDEAGNAGKTDLEKLKANLEKTASILKAREDEIATLKATSAKRERDWKVQGVIDAAGISFVEGVDAKILKGALAGTFADLDDKDLENPNVLAPRIDAFKKANKAVIVDKSGHGSGGNSHAGSGTGTGTPGGKTPDQQSTDERAAALRGKK